MESYESIEINNVMKRSAPINRQQTDALVSYPKQVRDNQAINEINIVDVDGEKEALSPGQNNLNALQFE